MRTRISPLADRNLDGIWKFIARDSPTAADRVDLELHEAIKMLGENPGMGHRRSDVPDQRYRFWPVYSYIIAYRIEGDELVVVRVIHGARNVRRTLGRQVRGE
jgi:toxin ParE1/3/4